MENEEDKLAWYEWLFVPYFIPATIVDAIIKLIEKKLKKQKRISICALGERQTGKTIWLKYLQTGKIINNLGQTPGSIDFKPFDLKIEGDRIVHIEKGKDIGGEKDNRKNFWKDLVEKSDIVCYFVNIRDFLCKQEYHDNVIGGLDLVADFLKPTQKDSASKAKPKTKLPFIVLSYADELKKISVSESDAREKFTSELKNLKFKNFKKNTILVNLLDQNCQNELKKRIFKTFCNDEK